MVVEEDTEWGHFIEIDYGLSHESNRYRSVTCPVIHGNKVYQKPYKYGLFKQEPIPRTRCQTQPDNFENNSSLADNHPVLYIALKVINPCIKLLNYYDNSYDENKKEDASIKISQPLPPKMSFTKKTSLTNLDKHTNHELSKNTYTIKEEEESIYNEEDYLDNPDKMNPSTMAIVSMISICAVYLMI
jgi:hypothetical protein